MFGSMSVHGRQESGQVLTNVTIYEEVNGA